MVSVCSRLGDSWSVVGVALAVVSGWHLEASCGLSRTKGAESAANGKTLQKNSI